MPEATTTIKVGCLPCFVDILSFKGLRFWLKSWWFSLTYYLLHVSVVFNALKGWGGVLLQVLRPLFLSCPSADLLLWSQMKSVPSFRHIPPPQLLLCLPVNLNSIHKLVRLLHVCARVTASMYMQEGIYNFTTVCQCVCVCVCMETVSRCSAVAWRRQLHSIRSDC